MKPICRVGVWAGMLLLAAGACWATEYSVGAHYYPWYGANNFHSPAGTYSSIRWYLLPAQQPALGWYDSYDPEVISAHFLWARSAGIDFFICSYWGSADGTAWAIKNCMLPNPDIGNLKLCVMLDGDPIAGPITKDNVGAETLWLCDNLFADPGYYRIDGKPVVMAYNVIKLSDADLSTYCANIRSAAASRGYQIYLVGDEAYGILPRTSPSHSSAARCANFDAVMSYNQYSIFKAYGAGKYASQSVVNAWDSNNGAWKSLANSAGVDYFPTVEPGFNDTEVRGNHHSPLSRKLGSDAGSEGSLFAAELDKAKTRCDRSTILVTTWNEWHEDTEIEPCVPAGAVSSTINTSLPVQLMSGETGSPTTAGLNYVGFDTTYLDILRSKTSDVPPPPASPSNPGATDVTGTSIQWTWQDNSATETGFDVYVDPGTAMPATLLTTTAPGATSWQQSGLFPNTWYSFQVTAANGPSQSLRTPLLSACTLAASPTVGANVICSQNTGQACPAGTTFTFDNPAGFSNGGPFSVAGFQYAWDNLSTHSWNGSEALWTGGTIAFTPLVSGGFYLHLRSQNQAGVLSNAALDYGPFVVDATPPTSSVSPSGGAYVAPLTVHLFASEPGAIYYTINGSQPTPSSPAYTGPLTLNADTTLRFYAVDEAGNAEAAQHTEVYKVLVSDGRIGDVRKQAGGTSVRLGNKVLYWQAGTLGFIEEPDRSSGIAILANSLPPNGMVSLTGTLQRLSPTQSRILADTVTPAGAGAVAPLSAGIAALKLPLMSALAVRAWGMVKPGSLRASSFVLEDGSDPSGLPVITSYASGSPAQGEFVIVTGALGFNGYPVLYATGIAGL